MNGSEITAQPAADDSLAVYRRIAALEHEAKTCHEAAKALQRMKEKYKDFFDRAPDMFLSIDPEQGTILDCNQTLADELGYHKNELIGRPVVDLYHPDSVPAERSAFHQFRRTGEVPHAQLTLRRRDGSILEVSLKTSAVRDENGVILRSRSVFRNVSEIKREAEGQARRQAQLLEAQHLESLGILAGGIAHHFNNLLTQMMGGVELARMDLDPTHPSHLELTRVLSAGDRAAKLAHQMLAYSGKGAFVIRPTNLSRQVREISSLLNTSLGKRVELRLALDDSLPPINADAAQLQQLIMNLIMNAADAQSGVGTVHLETGRAEIDEAGLGQLVHTDDAQLGPAAYLKIEDRGCGMDENTLKRIFDPFFTTKFTGRGLGLAAVLGIVRGHKGGLRVQSRPGVGSTFTVFFPTRPTRALGANGSAGNGGAGKLRLRPIANARRDERG